MTLLDALDFIARRRPPMTPPRTHLAPVGGGDFAAMGEHLAQLLIRSGNLRPCDRLLDVGCGIGRVAVPLTPYLTTGEYAGFDVSRRAVDWCRREISARYANFWFTHVDVFNSHYNAKGAIQPTDFVFPCGDESVDVAFVGSLMTHLVPSSAAQYLRQTARVLKRGGRAVITFFMLDDVIRQQTEHGQLVPAFRTFPEPWWAIRDSDDPEAAVAYDVGVVERAFADVGLAVTTVSRGAWSLHDDALTFQDVVIARKQ